METQWFSSSSHAHWLYPSPPRSPSRPTSKDLGSPCVECSTTARWCLKEGPGASLVATTLGILHPAAAAPVGSGRGSPHPHVSPRWLALASSSSHKVSFVLHFFPQPAMSLKALQIPPALPSQSCEFPTDLSGAPYLRTGNVPCAWPNAPANFSPNFCAARTVRA